MAVNTNSSNVQAPLAPVTQVDLATQQKSGDVNPLYVPEILFKIFADCDEDTLGKLAQVDTFFYACVQDYAKQELKWIGHVLTILDAKAQGLTINDEPHINKLQLLKYVKELAPHVENGEGLTLLTMPRGLILNQLVAIAAEQGITVNVSWMHILQEQGEIPVEQTYVILITNSIFKDSRNKSYALQQECVAGHECKMPTVQEYVALCVFNNQILQKCLYGQAPRTFGRSSTSVGGHPLVVGGSTPTHLYVESSRSSVANIGVSGRRKF